MSTILTNLELLAYVKQSKQNMRKLLDTQITNTFIAFDLAKSVIHVSYACN